MKLNSFIPCLYFDINFINELYIFSVRPKLRKVERRLVPVLEMLSVDELMETNTYQRFNKLIESVFEAIDDDILITDEMGKSELHNLEEIANSQSCRVTSQV